MEVNEFLNKQSLLTSVGENLEIFSLIWLDVSINNLHDNNIDIEQQIRSIINYLKIFEDTDDCEQYIRSLSNDDRLIFIVNEKLALEFLPRIHELRQITAIYIYSIDTQQDYQWVSQYKKIKSIKNDLNELVIQMKNDHIKRKKLEEPLTINIFNTNQANDSLPLNTNINTQFLYSQIIIHFLLHTKLTNEQIIENKKELIDLCKLEYNDNPNQLKILNEFEHNYSPSNALEFIHILRGLTSTTKRVYRSYIISNDEFQLFEESIGKYISINRFFSTYINRDNALFYFNEYEYDEKCSKKILFKIDADPRLIKIKPFANITVHNQSHEEEILFSLGSIFRLENIQHGKTDHYTIHLLLTNDDNHHLKSIFDHIKYQYGENDINLLSFGNALRRMGKLDQAEKCYQRLLNDSTYDQDLISRSYHHLGRIAETKGEYDTSLDYLYQSLDIKLKIMKSNDPSIAQSYNSIGIVCQQKGDHEKALEAFNKALNIWKRAYGRNHPNVAGCYNNMGVVYKREKNYTEALECFQKALHIRQKHPSTNHYDLAGSYNNIGAVYERLGHHDLAIEHYNLSLKIKSKSLPPHHPSIASTFENLGYVYENRGAYLQALSYLEKAAMIYRQSLPTTNHELSQIEQSIQRVSSKL